MGDRTNQFGFLQGGQSPAGDRPESAPIREQQPRAALAPREEEVLRHLAAGSTYARAARHMGISVHTVDGYLRRIRAKFGVRTQAELVRLMLTLRLPAQRSA